MDTMSDIENAGQTLDSGESGVMPTKTIRGVIKHEDDGIVCVHVWNMEKGIEEIFVLNGKYISNTTLQVIIKNEGVLYGYDAYGKQTPVIPVNQ